CLFGAFLSPILLSLFLFSFNTPSPTEIYTLSLHDALPIYPLFSGFGHDGFCDWQFYQMLNDSHVVEFDDKRIPFEPILEVASSRSEEHTSELQSPYDLVCRLLLEKKKKKKQKKYRRFKRH